MDVKTRFEREGDIIPVRVSGTIRRCLPLEYKGRRTWHRRWVSTRYNTLNIWFFRTEGTEDRVDVLMINHCSIDHEYHLHTWKRNLKEVKALKTYE